MYTHTYLKIPVQRVNSPSGTEKISAIFKRNKKIFLLCLCVYLLSIQSFAQCGDYFAQNTSSVWKGKTTSTVTYSYDGATTQNNVETLTNGTATFYVNTSGGDKRMAKSDDLTNGYTINFSPAVKASEIGFYIIDFDAAVISSPSSPTTEYTFTVSGGATSNNFTTTNISIPHPMTYTASTGKITSAGAFENQGICLIGTGNNLVSSITVKSNGGVSGNDLVAYSFFANNCYTVSGKVLGDANGLTDSTVNGSGTNVGGALFAQLVNSSNAVIATTAVAADGSYSFANLNAGTYTVVINQSSTANNSPSLPSGWVNTGEHNGTGAGNDGNANGKSASITVTTTDVSNINFGIERLPTANAVSSSSQVNPGGTITVTVPTLNGSDPEQGAFPGTGNADTIIINTLPTNGTLYYNGIAVNAGDTIKNYNPALLKVDPNSGAITVSFTYSEVDAALKSSTPANVTMNFTALSVSGNVLNDANGLTDNTINGSGTNIAGGLFAQLLDNGGAVIATTSVAADGMYGFPGLDAGTYSVVINQSSTANNTPSLPSGWVNTGENNGTGAGSDGNANGTSAPVTLTTINVGNINFGVEKIPTANPVSASYVNPGGTNTVTVPTLNGTDNEQGIFPGTGNADTIIINTLPTNGTLYYNGVPVVAGDTLKNYNPTLLTVDPNDGAITVNFTYSEVDAALKSSVPANVTMDFTTLTLSGNVLNDANGLTDNTINGSGTNIAGGLFAQLLDNGGTVIATTPVAADGTYSFPGLNAGTYSVVINQSSTANNTPSLPSGWVNTGENNGTGSGSDGNANGTSSPVTLTTANVSDINFGVEKIPSANSVNSSYINPGGTNTVTVPTLNGTDNEQGTFPGTGNADTIIINTLPTNGTLYYNGLPVVAGDTLKNYNPTLLTVDPNDGSITVNFTYSEVDAALRSSTPANVILAFTTTLSISGNVFDDANSMQDEIVNGSGTNIGGVLYAQLLDNSGTVIATTPVGTDGIYNFYSLGAGTYSIVINQSATANSTPSVPAGWLNTGENIGAGAGNDGTANGASASFTLTTDNVSNVNFGMEQLPTANPVSASYPNPGGTNTVTVPTLNGSDPEDGIYNGTSNTNTVIINTLPTNGTLYYNGVPVAAGDTIKNYNPTLLTVDPNDGAITVNFTYSEVDAASKSSTPASVIMDFTTLSISGNVLNDANGIEDGTVNGTGTNISNALFAQLLDNSGTVIATTPVAADGTYNFPGLNGGTYSVVINQSATANSTSSIPAGWVNTGDNIGTGAGNDGTANGTSAPITLTTTDVSNVNFAMEQLPTANPVSASYPNPGGTNTVTVPTLNGSDPEDGTYNGTSNTNTVIINTLPTNGTLYYNGVPVVAGDTIKNYNPALLTVDPNDGAITVNFSYSEVDAALKSSIPANVTMDFTTLTLSGNVLNDANGLTDNTINGSGTNIAGGLFAQLLDNGGTVIATTPVATDGTYSFPDLNGGTYSVLINQSSTANNTPSLPSGWVNTGENIGTDAGNDGNVNGTSTPITLTTTDVSNVNFALEQLPTANSVDSSYINPGGTNTVTVPTLNGNDPEDGIYTGTSNTNTVIINTLPTNGTLYYNGVPVVAGDTIKNYNPTLLTVDPNDGAIVLNFTYSEVDAALKSSTPATVTMDFTMMRISGTVLNDANGLTDATINGSGTNIGNTLSALLLDNSGTVIANTPVAADGTYSFIGLNPGTYSVVINETSSADHTPSLPSGWVNTGENIGTGAGNDGDANGISASITLTTANVGNVNFGIERLPTANAVSSTQVNPGGTTTVTVPTLNGTDPEQGTFPGTGNADTIIINTLPTNGTLYYDEVPVNAGDTIKNYNPSLLTVDPNDGAITVSFTYSEVDAALRPSVPANVTMGFTTILPVKLQSFTAAIQNNSVQLNWIVNDEINVSYYDVQYSTNGIVWNSIGNKAAVANRTYNFIDANAANGIVYYRLRIVDKDGKMLFSEISKVNMAIRNAEVSLYPIPARNTINVTLGASIVNNPVSINILSIDGKLLHQKKISRANQTEMIDVTKLPAGQYIVHIKTTNETISKKIEIYR